MKKLIVLLTFVALTGLAYGQPGVSNALSAKDQGKLDKALQAIESAVDKNNPKSAKSINAPRTWEVRGEIYQAIGQLQLKAKQPSIKIGMTKAEVVNNLGTPKNISKTTVASGTEELLFYEGYTVNIDNSGKVNYINTTGITYSSSEGKVINIKDPLTEAYQSYKKALELDKKGRNANSIKIKLTLLTNDLTNQAIEAFNKEDYKKALNSFEQILEMEQLPVIKKDSPSAIDTVIIFNSGLAAFNGGDYEKAIKYYSEAAKYGYNGGRSYQLLSKAYLENKDTLSAISTLNKAFEAYPSDNGVLVEMINIYINTKKTDEAMKYLQLAIQQDPKNASYYFAQGSLLDGMGKQDDAILSYEKAIELNPEFYDALYNLGALYYNRGVKQIEVANKVPANENARYEAELAKSDQWFAKSLPFMERCNVLKPDDTYSLESLKNLYYRLKQMEKYEQVLKKLGQ